MHAQKSELSIKGSASVSVKPTVTVISMNIRTTDDSYTTSIQNLINRVYKLSEAMKEIGFKEEEIVTSNFTINKRFNYAQGKRDEEIFDANQTLMVQFKQSKERLLEVINKATSSEANPEIQIRFELGSEQKKEVKKELVKLAIKDAKANAELISSEAGYKLMGIKNISYGQSANYPGPLMFAEEELEIKLQEVVVTNMEVANLSFTETVDIVFLMEEE